MRRRILFLAIMALAASLASGCMYSTGETEVGVRTKKLALIGEGGVEPTIYAQGGTYFFFPFINDWHVFDTKLQNLEMTAETRSGDRRVKDDLLFKTIDGNDIGLDVIVAYRIDPAKAPHILQYVARNDRELREKVVRTVARSLPRDVFGELKTEEFYVASSRIEKAERARELLQKALAPYGVVVERVLPKDYRFNPAYQKAIEGKKVADQEAEKNKSATRAAYEEWRRRVEEAKGEVNEMVAKADGRFERARIEADAYFEKQKAAAEAIRLEGEAEAEAIKKMNQALAGAGGETMVRLEVAKALKDKRIVLLPMSEGGFNLKTTNINDLLRLQGLTNLGK